jgi:hypothetical protein
MPSVRRRAGGPGPGSASHTGPAPAAGAASAAAGAAGGARPGGTAGDSMLNGGNSPERVIAG